MELTQYIDEKMIENKDVKDYGKDYEYTYQFEPLMDELFELRKQHGNKLLKILSEFIFKHNIEEYASIKLAMEFLGHVDAKETLVNILDNHTDEKTRYLAFKFVNSHIDVLEARYETEPDELIQGYMRELLLYNDIKNEKISSALIRMIHTGTHLEEWYKDEIESHGVETTLDNIKQVLKSKYVSDANLKKITSFLLDKEVML